MEEFDSGKANLSNFVFQFDVLCFGYWQNMGSIEKGAVPNFNLKNTRSMGESGYASLLNGASEAHYSSK